MRRKHYSKETVTYKFKLEILTMKGNSSLSLENREKLWKIYLFSLYKEDFITKFQCETWKYPNVLK